MSKLNGPNICHNWVIVFIVTNKIIVHLLTSIVLLLNSPPIYICVCWTYFYFCLQYSDLSYTTYPNLSKTVFAIFMVLVPILLLNMLIAMMGNTYAHVIEQSEKEWVKQVNSFFLLFIYLTMKKQFSCVTLFFQCSIKF